MAGRKKIKDKNGKRRLQSRILMEEMIGRPLMPKEVVHHIDENPSNDSTDNLQLFDSRAEHNRHHLLGKRRKRPEFFVCAGCGEEVPYPKTGRRRKYCTPECYRTTLAGEGNPNYRHGLHVKGRG